MSVLRRYALKLRNKSKLVYNVKSYKSYVKKYCKVDCWWYSQILYPILPYLPLPFTSPLYSLVRGWWRATQEKLLPVLERKTPILVTARFLKQVWSWNGRFVPLLFWLIAVLQSGASRLQGRVLWNGVASPLSVEGPPVLGTVWTWGYIFGLA